MAQMVGPMNETINIEAHLIAWKIEITIEPADKIYEDVKHLCQTDTRKTVHI